MLSKVSAAMVESYMDKRKFENPDPLKESKVLFDEMLKSQPLLGCFLIQMVDETFSDEYDKIKAMWGVAVTWKLLSQADEVEELENQL